MTDLIADYPVPVALAFLLAGILLGLVHFASLRRVSSLYLSGASPGRALALQMARLAVLAGALAGFALLGALPLLAATLGLFIGRAIILRRAGGAA